VCPCLWPCGGGGVTTPPGGAREKKVVFFVKPLISIENWVKKNVGPGSLKSKMFFLFVKPGFLFFGFPPYVFFLDWPHPNPFWGSPTASQLLKSVFSQGSISCCSIKPPFFRLLPSQHYTKAGKISRLE